MKTVCTEIPEKTVFSLKIPNSGLQEQLGTELAIRLYQKGIQILFDEQTRKRGYFNMPFIENLWKEHQQGRNVRDTHLWLLLNFELWNRIYMDNNGR